MSVSPSFAISFSSFFDLVFFSASAGGSTDREMQHNAPKHLLDGVCSE
jgi:hypothetical protein